MRKRLMIGLAVGALVAAMAPAHAIAGGPPTFNTGQCLKADVFDRAADPSDGRAPIVALDLGDRGPLGNGLFTTATACPLSPPGQA